MSTLKPDWDYYRDQPATETRREGRHKPHLTFSFNSAKFLWECEVWPTRGMGTTSLCKGRGNGPSVAMQRAWANFKLSFAQASTFNSGV